MASINKQTISGDLDVGRNMATGGNLSVTGKAEFGGRVTVKGFLDAPNLKVPCKGIFATDTELKNACPRPQSGWFAYVEAQDTGNGEEKPSGSADGSKLYWVFRAYNGEWVASGYDSLEASVEMSGIEEQIDGDDGINARLSTVESAVNTLSESVGGTESGDGTSLTEKVGTLEKAVDTLDGTVSSLRATVQGEGTGLVSKVSSLEEEVQTLAESATENTLKHYGENVDDMEYDTENRHVDSGNDPDGSLKTNAIMSLNKSIEDARVKVVAQSVFIETSKFEIERNAEGQNTGRIIRTADSNYGGSIYLTTPNGIIQRATRITLNALERVDQTKDGETTNGKIELYTTFDKDITHNNSRVLTERDIFNGDLDEIPTTDADGEAQEKWALDARLAKKMANGAWGGTVRFDGIQNLEESGVTLVDGTMPANGDEGYFAGVLWLEDRLMFVGVFAKVAIDCDKEYIVHEYYTDWSTADYYMETPGEEGCLWKEKIYIHSGAVWVWKRCENQLVKAGKSYHPITEEQIDKLMEDFKFVEMGNLIRKIQTEAEDPLGLCATYEDETVTLKGKVALEDIGAGEVEEMFEEVTNG